ncbi:hypothetical protein J27TS7_39310 [Paenibacillus dendritiformis]|nr:hypothetical protein J27TS7_39310 [Paenibacillus dendritiformis]
MSAHSGLKYQEQEGPAQSPGNQEMFQHVGFKGGSANYILNTAMHAMNRDYNFTKILWFLKNIAKQAYRTSKRS